MLQSSAVMPPQDDLGRPGCASCAGRFKHEFDLTMAFQPIVDATTGEIFAHEALVRGPNNEPAGQILAEVDERNRYQFDQSCRSKAIELASGLINGPLLSINFMPLAVYRPELCIRATLNAAERYGFPLEKIIFEFTEDEKIDDIGHVRAIVDYYRGLGFLVALDDFGAGHAGLALLADLQTDFVKLDMALIRGIDVDPRRRAIVGGIVRICDELGIRLIAEGIETRDELVATFDLGITLLQGYFLGRPTFQTITGIRNECESVIGQLNSRESRLSQPSG